MILFLALSLATLAHAAPGKTETLWKEWYLVTQNGQAISLFEEVAEKRPADHQLAITQKWVEKIGASPRSEVYIGSVAEESSLAPVAFFVERKGGKPYKTDGRAKDKKLEVTFKPGTADLAKSTEFTPLQPGMFFSSFVSTAIARHFKEGKGAFAFTAVVEDAGEMNVEIKKGTAEINKVEKKIGKESCKQAVVQFDGKMQEWWITKKGKVCLMELPDSNTRLELSSEKAAKKALKEGS